MGLREENLLQPLRVLNEIVSNEMCVGCGVCIAQANMLEDIEMKWNANGFLIPDFGKIENIPTNSLSVCPFNPFPDKAVRTENELADIFLGQSPKQYNKIGRYYNTYVGHADQFRLTSSSGGLGTYVTYKLLEDHIVDVVFSVSESSEKGKPYAYSMLTRKEDVLIGSKTRYFPVSMAEVLKKLSDIEGKVAIVGIPCFIKAIRLHQYYNPEAKDKIAFLIGIICGGMKNRFFAEYLASKSGANPALFHKPEFRVKDYNSTALDYSYSCEDENAVQYQIKMAKVGDMWGTGFFKNNACDFCDDVAAELADITLGDAWISPYKQDGKGSNVIITRSAVAERLIQEGLSSGDLILDPLEEERFIQSQQGGYNHRHRGMKYRIALADKRHKMIPPKRYDKENISFEFKWVQKMRMKVRALSIALWKKEKDAVHFDDAMRNPLKELHRYTNLYHKIRKLKNKVQRVIP